MLESEIKKLTVAVTELTATINGGTITKIPAAEAPAAAGAAAVDVFAEAPAAAAPAAAAPAAAAPAAAAPAAAAPVVEVPAAALTKKTLTEKFIELAQGKGREVATQLLAQYGVGSLPELKDKAQWPAFFAACEAKLAQ